MGGEGKVSAKIRGDTLGSSYIYLIGPEGGPLKIGISTQPEIRAKQLQTAHPRRVAVFGYWQHPNARTVEAEAHRLLAAWRLSGEWFEIDQNRAAVAIAPAISNVNSDYRSQFNAFDRPSMLEEVKTFLSKESAGQWNNTVAVIKPDAAPMPGRGDQEFRLGYARHVPDVDLVRQIEWLEVSGVNPLEIFIETDRCKNSVLKKALREFRPRDRFLVMSREILGGPEYMHWLVEMAQKYHITVQYGDELISYDNLSC